MSSDQALHLRPETDADLGFLAQVYASTRQEEVAQTGWPQAQIDAFLAMQFEAQTRHYRQHYKRERFCVIDYQGQPVGRLYVHRSRGEIRIVDIALLPSWRRQGLGTRLLRELFAESADAGLPITIHVEKNNPALCWYERLGFVAQEDKGVYWLLERPAEAIVDC